MCFDEMVWIKEPEQPAGEEAFFSVMHTATDLCEIQPQAYWKYLSTKVTRKPENDNTWKNTLTSYMNISRDCHVKRPPLSLITSQPRFTKDFMRWLNERLQKKITSTDTQSTANNIWRRLNPFCTLYFLQGS